ncbi:MAG TPA: hypothetical protein VET48_14565 [Steroidobacteraceae bacterium]|nr:hypothetical protein [Steroidobacteraceae bacterium]
MRFERQIIVVRQLLSFMLAAVLAACVSSAHVKKKDYSEINIATVSGCDKPSMQFHELRDQRAHPIAASVLPMRVKPGVYTIGIECSWTHSDVGACIDTHGNPELKVPTYPLILNPKASYVFSCDLEGKEYVIRMSENSR